MYKRASRNHSRNARDGSGPAHWIQTTDVLCKWCYMFYSALDEVFTNDPQLRVAYLMNYNDKGRRQLIIESHGVARTANVQWLKTVLLYFYNKPMQAVDAAVGTSQQNDTRADMSTVPTFTQEHIHCHIVRYSLLMPHSDSARYRPSSHVPPARSNPLRFVKSAR